jgi:hypothetical protein
MYPHDVGVVIFVSSRNERCDDERFCVVKSHVEGQSPTHEMPWPMQSTTEKLFDKSWLLPDSRM